MPKFSVEPQDPKAIKRLHALKDYSYGKLEPFRKHRILSLRQYVGAHYGPPDAGPGDRVPMNLLELAVNIYLRQLAASAPTVIWNTRGNVALAPTAAAAELYHNWLLREIDFKRSARMWVLEGMFGLSPMKVGLTPKGKAWQDAAGVLHDAGQIFADPILLEDWVHDMTATRYEQVQYAGHRYCLPLDLVVEDPSFTLGEHDGDRLRLAAKSRGRTYAAIDASTSDAGSLSRGTEPETQEPLIALTDLWDLWVPASGQVVTIAEGIQDHALRVVDWRGPETGPYHLMSFEDVPGNVMPLPPVALMRDLHDLANQLFLKLGRQAARQKSNVGYRHGAEAAAESLKNAADGEYIAMQDPSALTAFRSGGIDQPTMAFLSQLRDLYSYILGNLDALGGLSPQSQTLGQDELLTASASRRLADMRERVAEATASVQRAIAHYIWYDPSIDKTLMRRIGGPGEAGVDVPLRFRSDAKEGDILDFSVEILPNSMQQLTPSERLRTITNTLTQLYIPLAALMSQQGVTLDMPTLLDILARYSGVPELKDIVTVGPPAAVNERPRQSPVTTRTNVRRSVSPRTAVKREVAGRLGPREPAAITPLGGPAR